MVLARMGSERFPGKALTLIDNKPLIEWCISGLLPADDYSIVLATSDDQSDDPLATWAEEFGITCFRGSNENVAKRVSDCIAKFDIDYFARINGDSPLVNRPNLVRAFKIAEQGEYDLVTNLVPRSFPYGISIEVIKSTTYIEHIVPLTDVVYQEHITTYFYRNLELFNYYCISYEGGNDHDIRLVVDKPEDKEKIENLLQHIPKDKMHALDEIVKIYKNLYGSL